MSWRTKSKAEHAHKKINRMNLVEVTEAISKAVKHQSSKDGSLPTSADYQRLVARKQQLEG